MNCFKKQVTKERAHFLGKQLDNVKTFPLHGLPKIHGVFHYSPLFPPRVINQVSSIFSQGSKLINVNHLLETVTSL